MKRKEKCRGCGSSRPVIKHYILADDIENPKPYHPSCMRKLKIEVLSKLSDSFISQPKI